MKPSIIRLIILIAGSGLSIPIVLFGLFASGSFMSGIIGDAPGSTPGIEYVDLEWIMELIWILMMFLIPLSVLLAWFKTKTGANLLTIFATIWIIVFYVFLNHPEFAWMHIAILPIGPLLRYYVYYNKLWLKKKST